MAEVGVEEPKLFVKLSGIPWAASQTDVAYFLAGCDIKGGKQNGVIFYKNEEGRASGCCFVHLISPEDVTTALKKDKEYMGGRWVHVVTVDEKEVVSTIQATAPPDDHECEAFIVKCRGMPWSATATDIAVFFAGCDLKGGKTEAIHILKNEEGRPTGQAFVQFMSSNDMNTALSRDREHMGSRYIEVIKIKQTEMDRENEKSKIANENRGPVVSLRGLPWSTTQLDVEQFFSGLQIVEIQIVCSEDGVRPSGECFVEFQTLDDCDSALQKTGEKIGARYIEVYQSNRRYWHDQRKPKDDIVPAGGGRPRASPYDRDPAENMTMLQSVTRAPRLKSVQSRGPGYGGMEGYQAQSYQNPRPQEVPPTGRASGATKHCVLLKGVSCDISVGDIIKFFAGTVLPKNVEMRFAPGSMVGCAVVELNTHADAMTAMLKDKGLLDGVQVNLSLQSKPEDYYNSGGYDAVMPPLASGYETYGQNAIYQSIDPYHDTQIGGGGYNRW